ncbi:vWA domain-containing protein [Rufibacter roseus]|uniref:von Willebrand factor type A domain-containing protein n=1 Tax=Rufibacter roseus TaxID=1567108 RepID=A0ABW2DM38_9BACT|nr:VWA domain-containing protein [Rufibacter roseus]
MKKFISTIAFMLLVFVLQAQDRIITGTVTDAQSSQRMPGVTVQVKGTATAVATDQYGAYSITVPAQRDILVFTFLGYKSQEVKIGKQTKINVKLAVDGRALEEVVVTGYGTKSKSGKILIRGVAGIKSSVKFTPPVVKRDQEVIGDYNTEEYTTIHDNAFLEPKNNPLSTFSIDVDNASYSNLRRFLHNGQTPPKDAVRIEEMINYFNYQYPQPQGEHPFSVVTELSDCPWNKENKLLHIGLQGKEIPTENLPASNLVFLIDVSGSMDTPERLPLVKAGFKMLVEQLRPQDKVAIVVYAGAAGQVLEPTSGAEKGKIYAAIERLQAGGSTAGGAGIKLAYQLAQKNFVKGGNNRIILASDGDFNVGVSSTSELERLVEEKRESGVFLTVLGFGMGNYKDSRMETLADKGNGNYSYIDNLLEAKKVFVNEFGGTLFTIAKDVKLQLEFNPAVVKAYRLIGYENRMLKSEDFNNDKKDAGELGSGHTVTALYEIIPVGAASSTTLAKVDELKYQEVKATTKAVNPDEMVTIKLRYKEPDGAKSKLLQQVVQKNGIAFAQASDNFRFSAAVASFGMLLRDSEHKGASSYPLVLELAEGARSKDKEGYRVEFINMVKSMSLLSQNRD